jgi:mannosyltransferase
MSVDVFPVDAQATEPRPAAPGLVRRFPTERVFSRTGALAIVALLTLGSLLLRTRALHVHYWVDEGLSVMIAHHPLSKIPGLLRQDGSPPLYYVLLHIWMNLRGSSSEVVTHELSLIFALLTVPAAYWLGGSLFDRRAGLCSAALAAFVPYLTTYAQETRMYALMTLLSLLVAGGFVEVFVRRRRRFLPALIVAQAAALYTHNWGLFLALAVAIAFAVLVRLAPDSERRGLVRDGLITLAGVFVLFAPWIPTLLYQARHTGAPWALAPVWWSLSQGLYFITGGRGAAMTLLFGGGAGIYALWLRRREQPFLPNAALVLAVLGFGTLLIGWVYAKTTPAWAPRYLAVIVGPLIVLFGLGLSRGGRLGLIALCFALTFWILDPVSTGVNYKSNVATTLKIVRPHLGSDPLVLSTQPEQVPTIAFYLHRSARYVTPLGAVPDPGVMDWRNALHRFSRAPVRQVLQPTLRTLAPGQRVLLVVPATFPKAPLWMKLIDRTTKSWKRALEHDPALVEIKQTKKASADIGSGVEMLLFAQRQSLR